MVVYAAKVNSPVLILPTCQYAAPSFPLPVSMLVSNEGMDTLWPGIIKVTFMVGRPGKEDGKQLYALLTDIGGFPSPHTTLPTLSIPCIYYKEEGSFLDMWSAIFSTSS